MCLLNPVCSYSSDPAPRGPESSTQHCPSGCRSCTCSCKPSRSRRHPHKNHARTGWPACMPRRHRACPQRPASGTSHQPLMNHLARRRPQHRAEPHRLAPLRQPLEHRVEPVEHPTKKAGQESGKPCRSRRRGPCPRSPGHSSPQDLDHPVSRPMCQACASGSHHPHPRCHSRCPHP